MFVPLTPLEFRTRAERLFGSKVGVIDGEKRFTYAEFGDRSRRLAGALVSLGVKPGDVVSFLTYNTHHLLEAYFGVLQAGCVLNPLNIRLHPREIAYILNHA
jgi:fatty-acyl-CoA synthase